MNRFVRIVLNGSNKFIVGLVLVALPWLGSIYSCSRTPDNELGANSTPSSNSARAKASQPHLLPAGNSARCLPASDVQVQPSSAAEKSELASIPPSGLIAKEDFDGSPADSSPPVWTPKEMPVDEQNAESSPASKMSEDVANSASSAESAPTAQSMTVNDRSESPSTDWEHLYPSTEPLLTPLSSEKSAIKDLPVRSEQLESIARQADRQTRHGLELAGRGAYFAARSEFVAALRLLAQGLDADAKSKIHGKSLAAALTALKEAEDFLAGGSRLEADLDLSAIIAGHGTPVLKDADIASLTALTALKSYFTFAQEKFAQAEGNEVAGSMALHALGKLHEELAKGKGPGTKAAGPKAIVFYQAALLVCPQNFMAANDLGAMLARNGNYEDARKMLEYSLSLSKQSSVWHNLAVVYEHLGRIDKARQAQQQVVIALQMEQARRQNMLVGTGDQVSWVDENTFAQTSNPSGIRQGVPPVPAVSGNPLLQQAESASAPQRGILQPASNQYRPTNANVVQTSPIVIPPMPALQPAATGWISKTPYDARR
ncbi:MAG: hypothetical protein ABSA26_06820 [Thermoguttaceae bacterium]